MLVALLLVCGSVVPSLGDGATLDRHLLNIAVHAHLSATSVFEVATDSAGALPDVSAERLLDCRYVRVQDGAAAAHSLGFGLGAAPQMLRLLHKSRAFVRGHGVQVWLSDLSPDRDLLFQSFPLWWRGSSLVISPTTPLTNGQQLAEVLTISGAPKSKTVTIGMVMSRDGGAPTEYIAVAGRKRQLHVYAQIGTYTFRIMLLDGTDTPDQTFTVSEGSPPFEYVLPQ